MPNPSELCRIEEEDAEYEAKLRKENPWMQELTIRGLVNMRKYSLAGGQTLGVEYNTLKKG